MLCLSWPSDKVFPALDVLRLAVLNASASAILLQDDIKLLSVLLDNLSANKPANCQMLSLRVLSNLFSSPTTAAHSLMLAQREAVVTRAVATLPSDNKSVQVALSNLMLNFAVMSSLSGAGNNEEAQAQLLTSLCMLMLEATTDPEARFRTLVTLGTLIRASPSRNVALAKNMSAVVGVQAWKDALSGGKDGNKEAKAPQTPPDPETAKKIRECADHVLSDLS